MDSFTALWDWTRQHRSETTAVQVHQALARARFGCSYGTKTDVFLDALLLSWVS